MIEPISPGVAQLRLISNKYSQKSYLPPYLSSNCLNSTSAVFLGEWLKTSGKNQEQNFAQNKSSTRVAGFALSDFIALTLLVVWKNIFFKNCLFSFFLSFFLSLSLYVCMCVCVCVFGQHYFVNTYLIKQYKHFFTYICICPFRLPYRFYDI